MVTTKESRSPIPWAKIGTILGAVASEGGNVGHSFESGHAQVGAILFSALWPVMLFISFEVMISATWPDGKVWQIVRWAGMAPVIAVAFMVSWVHISWMLSHYGETDVVAYCGPIAVDAMMVLCSAALMVPKPQAVALPVLRKAPARKQPVPPVARAPVRRAVAPRKAPERKPVAVEVSPKVLTREGRAQAREKVEA